MSELPRHPLPAEDPASPHREQAEFEIDFFRRVLERNPKCLEVLKRQARLLTGFGDRAEALVCDEQLAVELPSDPQVRYHLACSLAVLGRADEAVRALVSAVELGFRDFEHLETDPDLAPLREHTQFQALLRGQASEK